MVKRTAKGRPGRRAQGPSPSAAALAKDTLGWWGGEYVKWLTERNYAARTVHDRQGYMRHFVAWCEARHLYYPQELTKPILERYQRSLYHFRSEDGRALSFRTQAQRLVYVRNLFRWLARQNVILYNPASDLELPKLPRTLPRFVLTAEEAESVLRLCDVNDALGLRDRAMLEVLYSTGIRRAEMCALRIFDMDVGRGTLLIREGKGKKDRVVPLSERTLEWVEKYQSDARPELVLGLDEGTLFLTSHGEPMTLMRASQLVRDYVRRANLNKTGSCHLFRHTAATLMLENGADIRYIQALLGHAQLSTTETYTQVSIHKLKEVHALTHPGARLVPKKASAREDVATDGAVEREELLSLLAAEADDEGDELGEGEG